MNGRQQHPQWKAHNSFAYSELTRLTVPLKDVVTLLRPFASGGNTMTTSKWCHRALDLSACLAAVLFTATEARAWDNCVALTPPLGWNSWNKFGCNVSEDLIKSMADGMV